jgi:hypothetical protein
LRRDGKFCVRFNVVRVRVVTFACLTELIFFVGF